MTFRKIFSRFGLLLMFVPIILAVVDRMFGLNIDTQIAKRACGDLYMIEPDLTLRSRGILTEEACGFNSDMYAAVVLFVCAFGAVLGVFRRYAVKKLRSAGFFLLGVVIGATAMFLAAFRLGGDGSEQSHNDAYLEGHRAVIDFMKEHLESDTPVSPYHYKYYVIEPVRKRGVKTFVILE